MLDPTPEPDDRRLTEAPRVKVYPFHGRFPGMDDLFHVSCSQHPQFGFCGTKDAADEARALHLDDHDPSALPEPDDREALDRLRVAFKDGAAWQRARHPEPVKPSREDVARLIDPAAWGCHDTCNVCKTGRSSSLRQADAVLALWPGRSVADVKVEAWDEGEEAGRHNERCIVDLDETTNPYRDERGES